MRLIRIALIATGIATLLVAFGFRTDLAWALALWPLPDTRLSHLFIAAILAGAAIPLLWAGVRGDLAGMIAYTLGFSLMFGAMGAYALLLFMRDQGGALLGFAVAAFALVVLLSVLGRRCRVVPTAPQPMPGALRIAFMIEVAVLAGVGVGLLLQVPNTLPWPLAPEASVMYGWVFVGMAVYFGHALAQPSWGNARGQLMGFLAYDLVLIGPFLQQFAVVRPEHWLRLVMATAIVVASGTLAIYYLFIHSHTRLWSSAPRLAPQNEYS